LTLAGDIGSSWWVRHGRGGGGVCGYRGAERRSLSWWASALVGRVRLVRVGSRAGPQDERKRGQETEDNGATPGLEFKVFFNRVLGVRVRAPPSSSPSHPKAGCVRPFGVSTRFAADLFSRVYAAGFGHYVPPCLLHPCLLIPKYARCGSMGRTQEASSVLSFLLPPPPPPPPLPLLPLLLPFRCGYAAVLTGRRHVAAYSTLLLSAGGVERATFETLSVVFRADCCPVLDFRLCWCCGWLVSIHLVLGCIFCRRLTLFLVRRTRIWSRAAFWVLVVRFVFAANIFFQQLDILDLYRVEGVRRLICVEPHSHGRGMHTTYYLAGADVALTPAGKYYRYIKSRRWWSFIHLSSLKYGRPGSWGVGQGGMRTVLAGPSQEERYGHSERGRGPALQVLGLW